MIRLPYLSPVPRLLNPDSVEYRIKFLSNYRKYKNSLLALDDSIEFDFSGYENESNKDKIRDISKGNCGYCGVGTTHVAQLEVEHYRPKKRLDIRPNEFVLHKKSLHKLPNKPITVIKHGYFIHGNDYKNLIPSCLLCNRGIKKKHSVLVIDSNLVFGISFGKRNYFPVWHMSVRGKKTDHRSSQIEVLRSDGEVPLLYNPYMDDPDVLFRYKPYINIDGVFYVKIAAGRKLRKVDRLKATISINMLGLNRKGLCQKRYDILSRLDSLKKGMMRDRVCQRLNLWANYACNVALIFSPEDAELIFFARQKGETLPIMLHSYLRRIFPDAAAGILSESLEFEQKILELKRFGAVHYNEDLDFESVDNEMSDFEL